MSHLGENEFGVFNKKVEVVPLSGYCSLNNPCFCDYFISFCFEPPLRTEGYPQLSNNAVDTFKADVN